MPSYTVLFCFVFVFFRFDWKSKMAALLTETVNSNFRDFEGGV